MTQDADMVERVAWAICEQEYTRRELVRPWWGDSASQPANSIRVSPFEKRMYRANARVAIAVILEQVGELSRPNTDAPPPTEYDQGWLDFAKVLTTILREEVAA